jgi:hypothetical protein
MSYGELAGGREGDGVRKVGFGTEDEVVSLRRGVYYPS